MNVREIPVDESGGLTLAYDLTGIDPGKNKRAVMRRGHVIGASDLEILHAIGKSHVKVLELAPDDVHEDDAARALGHMLAGQGIEVRMPGEAWADLVATHDGLLGVAEERLFRLNGLEDVLIATRHDNSVVKTGDTVARAKVRGLVVKQSVLDQAEDHAAALPKIVEVLPISTVQAAAVITGREIYEGRKKDAFEPLLRKRVEAYGSELIHAEIVPDEVEDIGRAITSALDLGAQIVLVSGGGSPDDCTAEAIGQVADEVVFCGVPVSPGAMTTLAYAKGAAILGVPGGLLARPRGFIDLVLPRLLAGDRPSADDAARYGHGGLCLGCPTCVFPSCSFGR